MAAEEEEADLFQQVLHMVEDILVMAVVEEAMVLAMVLGIMEELGLEDTLVEVLTHMETAAVLV